MIKRLCIIGVGLIGGSLARALRKAGAVEQVVGCGRKQANLEKAVELGVIDRFSTDVAEAVQGADMIVVAVPLQSMAAVFSALKDARAADAILTDVGSAKGSVVEAARMAFGEIPDWFVPGHPIAGTEQSGVEASFDSLYEGRRVILTPVEQTAAAAADAVRDMWQQAGAVVTDMTPEHHDDVLAATSHLPHILAFALVDALASRSDRGEIFDYAAGGFRDFTRIASSDPVMWRDISLANRDALLKALDMFREDLDVLRSAISNGDGEALRICFDRAKTARDGFTG